MEVSVMPTYNSVPGNAHVPNPQIMEVEDCLKHNLKCSPYFFKQSKSVAYSLADALQRFTNIFTTVFAMF